MKVRHQNKSYLTKTKVVTDGLMVSLCFFLNILCTMLKNITFCIIVPELYVRVDILLTCRKHL
jgi:hypothetical protein